MKKVLLDNVRTGMTTAEPVKTKKGQILAGAGTVLNSNHISRFTYYHIESVMIKDEDVMDSEVPEYQEDNKKQEEPKEDNQTFANRSLSYAQKLGRTEEFRNFQISYALCLEDLKRSFTRIKNHEFNVGKEPILIHSDEVSRYRYPIEMFNMIQAVRFSEDSIYSHCLNIALETLIFAKWLNFSSEEQYDLTSSALLHGIGKTEVDPAVLNKVGKLSDEERKEMQAHTLYGYDILKKAGFDQRICNVPLQYHERLDGSGYPHGLKKGEIDKFPQIIAILDIYDGMTSIRPYRQPLCAFQVIEEFERIGYGKFNTKFMLTFLQHLAGMNQNSMIMLDNGVSGRVVCINRSLISRPIIKTDDGLIIDLSKEPERHIVSVF